MATKRGGMTISFRQRSDDAEIGGLTHLVVTTVCGGIRGDEAFVDDVLWNTL
jgi:hypothetical protein